jgi:dsRNA-specific ribonuclease
VDTVPKFTFTEVPNPQRIIFPQAAPKLFIGSVTLPNSLIPSVRCTQGTGQWETQRAAAKDAAFQAYTSLHKAGLLSDNLLPLAQSWRLEEEDEEEDLEAVVEVSAYIGPWAAMAEAWTCADMHQTKIICRQVDEDDEVELHMVLSTPSAIPSLSSFLCYWDEATTFSIEFERSYKLGLTEPRNLQTMQSITHVLNQSTCSDYNIDDRTDFIALFSPDLTASELAAWHKANHGRVEPFEQYKAKSSPSGFIRSPAQHHSPYIFHRWCKSETDTDQKASVECTPLPKRRYFLIPSTLSRKTDALGSVDASDASRVENFPIESCTIDRLPFTYAQFSLFIPTILQHLEDAMTADRVQSTILKNVPINNRSHIITAISAPSAARPTNYQRYEFFGDTVLKFVVSYQLFCDQSNWHEGYLSRQKNRLVSNQRLAKAALAKGLDKYIMTEAFKTRKWKPMRLSDVHVVQGTKRSISMKALADVVEALIGVAFTDSGLKVAMQCINTFLPTIRKEIPLPKRVAAPQANFNTAHVLKAETIVGRTFKDKTLLREALTHAACIQDIHTGSYQRLEFLGDAVLDMIVIRYLVSSQATTPLSQGQMTLIKAAIVNTHFLGFLCIEYKVEQPRSGISMEHAALGIMKEKPLMEQMHLWKLMRHFHAGITKSQKDCLERCRVLRSSIFHSLEAGTTYPWVAFARLNLEKFYSDMLESLIGAIFIDSSGSFAACEKFIKSIGLMAYLERMVTGKVDIEHPKSILGRLAGSATVEYVEGNEFKTSPEGEEENRYKCAIKLNGNDFVAVDSCLSKEEATVVAADKAVEHLRGKGNTALPLRLLG